MLKVGAVIYSPNVTVIWGIIADFCKEEGCKIEPVFYKDYKMQVDGLMSGEIDIAWNSPLAWLDTHLRTAGKNLNGLMRDTDTHRRSYLVVKNDVSSVADLRGQKIGFGAYDSPQARLIPLYHLHKNGLNLGDFEEVRFDIGVGLHGDHVGGEMDALKALKNGELKASWMLDMNYDKWLKEGIIDSQNYKVLSKTDEFTHCIFCGRVGLDEGEFTKFSTTFKKMDYNNPKHKEMMDMEGLTRWIDGSLEGYAQITAANEYLGFLNNESQ